MAHPTPEIIVPCGDHGLTPGGDYVAEHTEVVGWNAEEDSFQHHDYPSTDAWTPETVKET